MARSPPRCGAWASGTTTEPPAARRRRRRTGWCLPAIAGEPARPRIVLVEPGNTSVTVTIHALAAEGDTPRRRRHADDRRRDRWIRFRRGSSRGSTAPRSRSARRVATSSPSRRRRRSVSRGFPRTPWRWECAIPAAIEIAAIDAEPASVRWRLRAKFLAIIGVVPRYHRGTHTPEPASGDPWLEEDTSSTLAAPPSWWRSRSGSCSLALGGVSFAAYRYDQASCRPDPSRCDDRRHRRGRHDAGRGHRGGRSAPLRSGSRRPLTVRVARTVVEDHACGARPDRPTSRRPWIRRSRRRTPSGSSRGCGIGSARSPSTSRSTSRSSAAGRGVTDLVSSIAADVAQTPRDASVARRRRQGDVRPLAARTRARRARRRRSDCRRRWMRTYDRGSAAGQDRQAQGPGREDRQDDRGRPDHQRALPVQRVRAREARITSPPPPRATSRRPGEWTIIDKRENPTWTNPAPDTWGADLPASIPPGPGNPLGTRALYLNAPGIRIHGTYDVSSIGTHASHGCIRMLMSDVEEIYPLVPIGTRVIVF